MKRRAGLVCLAATLVVLWPSQPVMTQTAPSVASSLPAPLASPIAIDRGAAAVLQSLRKLHTRASLIAIVAHPDDEDGGMLTYESRGQGADTTLLTLNRGEGGQNLMSSDFWDQLGLVRTEELLAADRYYGVHQYFARVADFGFSKTIDESMKTWGHDRVLYDAVRVVRMTRPLVVTSSFTGNVSDGHGQHQVSGAIAQEVFNAAADPKMFPDQIKAGLLPWAPLKVYARVPFARTSDKGIYDYATGHWEPVRFRNYVDGTFIEGIPSETVSLPVGQYDSALDQSYFNIGREGLGQQKSQIGSFAVPPVKPVFAAYHLYASRVESPLPAHEDNLFEGIDTSLAGIAAYAPPQEQNAWRERLKTLNALVEHATSTFEAADPAKTAPLLATGLAQVNALLADVARSDMPVDAQYNMAHELSVKQEQFNDALQQALELSVLAVVTDTGRGGDGALRSGAGVVVPGETFHVNLHVANQGSQPVTLTRADLKSQGVESQSGESQTGEAWKFLSNPGQAANMKSMAVNGGGALDRNVTVTVPAAAKSTRPYFTRPTLEQSYYDIDDARYLNLPTSPDPLTAEIDYTYNGVAAHVTSDVQTEHRLPDKRAALEPLLVAPAISVTVSPEAGIVPVSAQTFHLDVTVHSNVLGAAEGNLKLDLPSGWTAKPSIATFEIANGADKQVVTFEVTPKSVQPTAYTIRAIAEYKGKQYSEGYRTVGYAGLLPYPFYRAATYRASGVDVKTAPDLRIGYIMGTGDDVPQSMEDLGIHPTLLSPTDVTSGDLSRFDVLVLGIRTYAARPELKTSNDRLLDYVKRGGVVIVQYQTAEYDHGYGPYPLTLSDGAERVVEEDGEASVLDPADPALSWPNKITLSDFSGWVEERGHGFMRTWDPRYIAPTEMHDAGQEPQKGGLLYARYGQGVYVYVSYAFFRQMPEGVPGAYRIFANLISIGKNPAIRSGTANF